MVICVADGVTGERNRQRVMTVYIEGVYEWDVVIRKLILANKIGSG